MRAEKQFLFNEIQGLINAYKSFIVFRFLGLTANEANEIRRAIFKTGGNMEIVSKRIFLRVAREAGLSAKRENLDGHIGIVFTGDDSIATAKIFYDWIQERVDNFKILFGRIEEKDCNVSEIEEFAQLPGKEGLKAQFLSTLEAPLSQMVGLMQNLLTSVPYCLEGRSREAR